MSKVVTNIISHMLSGYRLWLVLAMLPVFTWHNPLRADEKKLDQVTLQLKWEHQFQFAGYYAAIENGYYRDVGLEVKLIPARPGHDPAEAVLTGKADFGIAGSTLAILRDKGKPVVVLAAIFQHSPLAILMKDDGAIADIHALIGKKVMLEPLSGELLAYFQVENINTDAITIVPHTFNVKDFVDGQVDAMSAYTTTEPYHLRKLKIPYKMLQPISCGIDFYGDCLFTTEQQIKLHPERVKAFREASLRGWKYAMAHPEDLIPIIRQKYNRKLSREQLQFEILEMRSLINPNVIEIGYMNQARWQHIVNTYRQTGQITSNIPLKKFIYAAAVPAFDKKPFYVAIALLALLAAGIGLTAMRFRKLNASLKHEIALRDHAEAELKETKSILEVAFDQSPAGIIIENAADGKIQYFNKAAHQFLGSPEEAEALGIGIEQLTPSQQLLHQTSTAVRHNKGPLATAILHGKSSAGEFIIRKFNHEPRTVWTTSAPVKDEHGIIKAGISLILDITEQKKVQMALAESEKRFSMMANTTPILLWMSEPSGECNYFNHYWLEFTGLTMKQAAGKGWSEWVHPEDRQRCLYTRTLALSTRQPFNIEFRLHHNSGGYRWIMDSGVPRFNADGMFLGFIGSGMDINELKQAEEALQLQYRLQKLLVEVAVKYINMPMEEFDATIQSSLRDLGEFFGADRAYIFDYDLERQVCSNTWEWCAAGITPQISELQAVPLTAVPEWLAAHRRGEPIYVPDVAGLPSGGLRNILEPQGIKSLLTVPIMSNNECLGFVGFDSVQKHCVYSDNEQHLLMIFAQILVNIKLRKQAAEKLNLERDNLKAVFAAAPVGMLLIDENALIVNHNDVIARLVSRESGQIIQQRSGNGLGCINSFEDERGCGFSPACKECALKNELEQVLQSGQPIYGQEMEYTVLINGQQHCMWLCINAVPVLLNGRKHVVVAVDEITKCKQNEAMLHNKIDEMERFHKLAVGRELAMIELKHEVNTLLVNNGLQAKYKIVDNGNK